MIKAFSAVGTRTDSFEAGRQAAGEAVSKLSAKPEMIWAFGAISYDQQRLLDGIAAASPGTPIISNRSCFHNETVTMTIIGE